MNDKVLSLLGLCRRAGKLVIGAEPVIESARSHRAKLIVFADDFSQNSLGPVVRAAEKYNVKILALGRSKDKISHAVGKLCGTASVEDEGFAKKLAELIGE